MNEIQNVESLTTEILILKQQTAQNIIEIGKRLIAVKESLPHGEWGKYLSEKVEFGKSTANNFMRVAKEFSNLQAIGSLPQTKVFALLEIPQEEREIFVKENDIENMSTRELQKAIKEKQALEEKLKDSIEFNKKAQKLASLREEERDEAIKTLESVKNTLKAEKDKLKKERENSKEEIAKLQSFIGEAQSTGDNEEVERLQAALKEIQNDLDSSAKKIDELEAKLKEKPIEVIANPEVIEKVPEEIEKELQELRVKVNQSSNNSVIKFKIYFEELQETFREQLELMDETKATDPQTYEKFKNAILNLINKMSERLSS